RDFHVTGVQTCALPISAGYSANNSSGRSKLKCDNFICSLFLAFSLYINNPRVFVEIYYFGKMQIYDLKVGVVKYLATYYFVISKPMLFRSSQKLGYDFETTSASLITIEVFSARGAKAKAIL